jgi:phosphatidylserine decarboxylase
MMEIGALMVGKIVNHHKAYTSIDVFRGQEKGYFAFGGSSILLLFQPHTVTIDRDIMRNTALDVETRVRMGEAIGQVMEAN